MGSLLYQLLMQLDIDAWSSVFSTACTSVSSISYCIEFVGTKTRVVYFRKWCGDVSLKTSQTLEIYISGYSFFIIARHHCIFPWCHELWSNQKEGSQFFCWWHGNFSGMCGVGGGGRGLFSLNQNKICLYGNMTKRFQILMNIDDPSMSWPTFRLAEKFWSFGWQNWISKS